MIDWTDEVRVEIIKKRPDLEEFVNDLIYNDRLGALQILHSLVVFEM